MIEHYIREKLQQAIDNGQAEQEHLTRLLLAKLKVQKDRGFEDLPLVRTDLEIPSRQITENTTQALTHQEICIYDALKTNSGNIVTYGQLNEACFGNKRNNRDAIYNAVSRLKGQVPEEILNLRGRGYMMRSS